jgi:hypothetical protein
MLAVEPVIQLLWWEGCPSWERALGMLRGAMREAGLDPGAVEVIEIRDDADAARLGFPGSPTIRVDGRDVQPPGPEEPGGLTCRVYRLRDGRVSPLPDPEDIREALAAASAGKEASDER